MPERVPSSEGLGGTFVTAKVFDVKLVIPGAWIKGARQLPTFQCDKKDLGCCSNHVAVADMATNNLPGFIGDAHVQMSTID